jgi:hypothetical protein
MRRIMNAAIRWPLYAMFLWNCSRSAATENAAEIAAPMPAPERTLPFRAMLQGYPHPGDQTFWDREYWNLLLARIFAWPE